MNDHSDILAHFVAAQHDIFPQVVAELAAGRKRSHWMWFIFPQLAGLGTSAMAERYALASREQAARYLAHPVLGPRLRQCVQLLLDLPTTDISAVLGYPDDLKLRSCLTLFALAAPTETLFPQALEKFYGSQLDPKTLDLLGESR